MATPPTFTAGSVLTAAQMNAVGMWLVKSQTIGTGVSSVTVTDAFSADFDNYRIMINFNSNTTNNQSGGLRLRTAAGVDSTTNYFYGWIYGNPSTGAVSSAGNSSGNRFDYAFNSYGTAGSSAAVDVMKPFLSALTMISSAAPRGDLVGNMTGYHSLADSYTGFTLLPSAGTLTGGTIRVYGYRN